MANALSLTPLFRQSVGFDHFNDLLESLTSENHSAPAFPPYDIVKKGENDYEIVMAVAGYQQEDLTIFLENGTLKVSGKNEEKTEEKSADEADTEHTYLYRGIAKRSFERSFKLAEHMKVTNADLDNGLLKISLVREIPEEQKPRLININS